MIKTLRKKFIAIAMCSMAVVLIIIIGGINIANYHNVNQTTDMRLSILVDNQGHFPLNLEDNTGNASPDDSHEFMEIHPSEEHLPDGMPDKAAAWQNNFLPDKKPHPQMSAEAPFDTRYFTVVLNADGAVISTDTGKIAAISTEEAYEYAYALFAQNKTSGYHDCYKYRAFTITSTSGEENTMYIFLNCERELNSFKSFLAASVIISLAGLLFVFILVFFFSKILVKPVAESYEKQKRFITDASHELKTPLTIIDANTEVLEMENGENEWTASIRNQVKRLASLTEKLVFLSRMDEENTSLTMTDFSLSDAVLETSQPFATVASRQHKELTINIEPNITFNGNEPSIRQLISLLLDNAIKYSTENGSICISLHASGRNKIITVENTTAGLTPGKLDILFERFYRTDVSRNSSTGGYGIGLSAAKAIVTAHKGKITAKSEDGTSILFTITLS